MPQTAAGGPRVGPAPAPLSEHAINRKTERLQHREHLYDVVRDSMIRAGVLGASYKFKVLSLDGHGRQFVIMMDLTAPMTGGAARQAEIEAMMAQTAKVRHDILVTAVYWRISEQVTAGLSSSSPLPAAAQPSVTPTPKPEPVPVPVPELQASSPLPAGASQTAESPRYEPLQQDEMIAFKRALASAVPRVPLSASGQIVTSGRRNPAPSGDFEDTQLVEADERTPPLSSTQYGNLS